MIDVEWILSDDPGDWAAQISALFTAASAILTAIYVWLTFHLMRWTARTATLALQEHHNLSFRRLAPLRAIGYELITLGGELKSAATAQDLMAISALASKLTYTGYSIDVYVDTSRQESISLYETFGSMRTSLRSAADAVALALRDGLSSELSAELARFAEDIGRHAENAVRTVGVELARGAASPSGRDLDRNKTVTP
jgi:hypothetical protein